MDCSLPGSSVCGISQARVLEWVAISFSRVISLMALLSVTETPLDCDTHTHTQKCIFVGELEITWFYYFQTGECYWLSGLVPSVSAVVFSTLGLGMHVSVLIW